MSVDIQTTQANFVIGKTTPLPIEGIVTGPRSYDILPDGKSFVMLLAAQSQTDSRKAPDQINITLNWFRELEERVPVK